MKLFVTLTLFAIVALTNAAAPFSWDSCGTKNDRLFTTDLEMKTPEGTWGKGFKATVTGKGDCNLHGPLLSGSWSMRIYELGLSHPVQTNTGDLMKAVKFLDDKNTTYALDFDFIMPPAHTSGHFQGSFTAQDDQHASYLCLDLFFNYTQA